MKKFVSFVALCFLLIVSLASSGVKPQVYPWSWKQIINIPGDFAMSGAYINDKLYLGGYGNGNIYSFLPLATELANSGEAILSMVTFNGEVYATSENNSNDQHTRILKRTNNGWVETGKISGYATYFMTVWNGYLIVMATTDLQSTDFWYSNDGVNFIKGYHFFDWLWIPTVFNGDLYILGHSGPANGPGSSKAVKWNGNTFVDVPALCNTPGVVEWQTATEHNGFLFVGAGGWILERGKSTAAVYRFDGTNAVPVLIDNKYHESQAILSSKINGFLYVSVGAGFKNDVGGSQLWASGDNGLTWLDAGHFPNCPQLYVLLDSPYGFLAAGGKQGNLQAYYFDTITPIEFKNICPQCGYKF